MAIVQQKFRELVLQTLYALTVSLHSDDEKEELCLMLQEQLEVSMVQVEKAYQKALEVVYQLELLDRKISSMSKEYALDRIHSVERCVLRLGLYELIFEPKVPQKVVLSEAVRLAKKFGTQEGSSFVNGVLDALYKEYNPLTVASSSDDIELAAV